LFPPTSDLSSSTLLATCLSHDSSGSSSNGSSTAFSFTDSAYASSQSPPPSLSQNSNNTTSQSISIMRSLQSQAQQQQKHHIKPPPPPPPISSHSSLLVGLTTASPSSSLSSIHSTNDNPSCSPFSHKQQQQQQQQEYQYNYWNCPGCQESYKQNRAQVLQCFHSLCETCIEKLSENETGNISCPLCGLTTMLTDILPDYTIQNNHSNEYMLSLGENSTQYCTACKSSESMAVAKCFQCSSFLCHQCVCAHQIMNCFEGHRVSQKYKKKKILFLIRLSFFFYLLAFFFPSYIPFD
jgi:hypothetical protein